MMAAAARLEGITQHYQGQAIFRQLHMQIAARRWTAILGASGVGKSTLLRVIAGLEQVDGGAVMIEDSGGARLGYVSQQPCLLPWLDVFANIALRSHLLAETCARERVEEALALCGIEHLRARKPALLSGGERQRVALARMVYERAGLILLDEPFSALDVPTRHVMQRLSHRLFRDATVVLVTHDPLEALCLADDIYVMRGTPATLHPLAMPDGLPPREVDAPGVATASVALMQELARPGTRESEGESGGESPCG